MNKFKEVSFGLIPCEWNLSSIDNIKDDGKYAIAMGPFGSNIKSENYVDNGVPVIRGINLNYFKYVGGDFVFLTEEKAATLKSSICKTGDLVFTHRGTIGQVCLIPCGKFDKYIISQSGMKLTVDKNKINNIFLLYFFKSKMGKNQILQYESQVGVPSISNPLSSLKMIEVPLPPLPEQKAIAGVLGSLDDKIDLLQRQNATLEAMAETLFRQWFIEEAQEDWEEYPLSSFIEIIGGGTPKTSEESYWNGDILWMSGGDIASSHKSFIFDTDKKISSEGLENSSAKLLPKFSTVITARGTVGKICLLGEQAAFSQTNYGILPRIAGTPFFTFLLMSDLLCYLKQSAYGSVFDTITRSTFEEIKFNCSTDNYIVNFENMISPFFQKIFSNCRQIRTLEKLRDTLLPKLMSGEVRVRVDG